MAIHPIDLQVLYTQMDKVSKTAVQQQQGAVLQNAMMTEALLQKNIEQTGVIEESKKEEKENNIKDKEGSSSDKEKESKNRKENSAKEEIETEYTVIKDPALGTHLDTSG